MSLVRRAIFTGLWGGVAALVLAHVLTASVQVWATTHGPARLVEVLDNQPSLDEGVPESSETAALKAAAARQAPAGPPWWLVGLVWMGIVAVVFGVFAWIMLG